MSNKKYELVETEQRPLGPNIRLFRIRALRDVGNDVKAGDMGGFIAGPINLDQEGECWVYPHAIVRAGARVSGNATVRDRAELFGNAAMSGNSSIGGDVQIFADIEMSGDDTLEGSMQVVALPVTAAGHYSLGGHTRFCFQCDLNSSTIHLEVPAASCASRVAARLATIGAGQKLAYLLMRGEFYDMEVGLYEGLALGTVKQMLDDIENDRRWSNRYPQNVIHMT